jgi:RNA polymerase sigma-70 factor, ECF subfamily
MEGAHRVAEQAARVSHGRLLAILAARTRGIAAAEDALVKAFATALCVWPERDMPKNPDACLLTTARNRAANMRRHDQIGEVLVTEIERR